MGLTLDKATDQLENLGLKVKADDTVDGKMIMSKKNWQVTSQDPTEGAKVAKDSTVHLGVKNLEKEAAEKAAADKAAAEKAAAAKAAADKVAADKAAADKAAADKAAAAAAAAKLAAEQAAAQKAVPQVPVAPAAPVAPLPRQSRRRPRPTTPAAPTRRQQGSRRSPPDSRATVPVLTGITTALPATNSRRFPEQLFCRGCLSLREGVHGRRL